MTPCGFLGCRGLDAVQKHLSGGRKSSFRACAAAAGLAWQPPARKVHKWPNGVETRAFLLGFGPPGALTPFKTARLPPALRERFERRRAAPPDCNIGVESAPSTP